MTRYQKWINDRLAKANPFALCKEWTLEMRADFPELRRVAGEVLLSNGLTRHHWWLETAAGEKVDPTASQFHQDYFGRAAILLYTEIPEDERPIGKCANCGEYCYAGAPDSMLCSDACARAYTAYVMGS